MQRMDDWDFITSSPGRQKMTRILLMLDLQKNSKPKRQRRRCWDRKEEGEGLPQRALPNEPLLDMSTNIRVRSQTQPVRSNKRTSFSLLRQKAQSDLVHINQQGLGPNTPCPLQSLGKIQIATRNDDRDDDDGGNVDGGYQYQLGNSRHTRGPKISRC